MNNLRGIPDALATVEKLATEKIQAKKDGK
jgi:hypothetical protein